jgi:hypothetical protein
MRLCGCGFATCVDMRRQEVLVLYIFLIAQFLDGALTYVGVMQFGIEAEGNVLLMSLMYAWGAGPALVAAKVFSGFCGVVLFAVSVYRVLAAAAGLCIGVAVVPWMAVLAWNAVR